MIRTGMDCGWCVSLFQPTAFLSVPAAAWGRHPYPLTSFHPSQLLLLVDSLQGDCTDPLRYLQTVPLLSASLPLVQTKASRLPDQNRSLLVPRVNPPLYFPVREELCETCIQRNRTLWPYGSETQGFYGLGQQLHQQEGRSQTQRDYCKSALIQPQVYLGGQMLGPRHSKCLGNQKWITRRMEGLGDAQFEIVQRREMH